MSDAATENSPELVIVGHQSPVGQLTFTQDGRTLISVGSDAAIVWDLPSQTMRRILPWPTEANITRGACSPDGRYLATSGWNLRHWDAEAGRMSRAFRLYREALAFSPDGHTLASIGYKPDWEHPFIFLSRFPSGRLRHSFPCGGLIPQYCLFSYDGRYIAVLAANDDETPSYMVTICDVTGEFPKQRQWKQRVLLSENSAWPDVPFVALSADGAFIWNAETGELLHTVHDGFPPPSPYQTFAAPVLSSDGLHMAVEPKSGYIRVHDMMASEYWEAKGHKGTITAMAFSPDEKTLATADVDHQIRLWDAETGELLGSLGDQRIQWQSVACSVDKKTISASDATGTAWRWDLETWKMEAGHAFVSDLQPTQNEWMTHAHLLQGLEVRHHSNDLGVVSPDGTRAVTSTSETETTLWNLTTGETLAVFEKRYPHCVIGGFSQDGTLLAVDDGLNAIQIRDARMGNLLHGWNVPPEHEVGGTFIFTSDNQTLASADVFHGIYLWDVKSQRKKRVLSPYWDSTRALAFSPDSRTLAVGSLYDSTIWLYGLGRGGKKRPLRGHSGHLRALMYSPCGAWLVSAADDGTIRFWGARSEQCLLTIRMLSHEDWVAYTSDGFYTGSEGVERFLLWRVGPDLLPGETFAKDHRWPNCLRDVLF